ncbi:hypothetical protein DSO57_1020065 [Entomophthora muscae]|uniref:Uncharacterized protein n=1 Tax=Entomophthora muscae TaxID=34485 RepID=A0ACC2TR72_9FUNG|nr:hypothetical protein DSO57_1020065 [Entomophthora muscae]
MALTISPTDAAYLKDKILSEDAAKWLKVGIETDQILIWKSMLPETEAAGEFARAGFTLATAMEWYDIGAIAAKLAIFAKGGWNPVTVTNWLHTNRLQYGDINKYIHQTICPAMTVEWKNHRFPATEAIKWASL